jgi:hypothetical protein
MNKTKFLVLALSLAVVLLRGTSQAAETNANSVTARAQPTPKEFVFEGGDLEDFVNAIAKTYGVDLFKIATIPEHMRSVRVPKMRVLTENFQTVLRLYNSTSSEDHGLMGSWIIRSMSESSNPLPSNRLPDLILLTGDLGQNHGKSFAVRAFAFKGLTDKGLDDLLLVIAEEADQLRRRMLNSGGIANSEIQGDVRYHKTAGILVVTGGNLYAEVAGSIIEAFRQAHGSEFNDAPVDAASGKK